MAIEPEPDSGGDDAGDPGVSPDETGELTVVERLDEIPGISPGLAQAILAEPVVHPEELDGAVVEPLLGNRVRREIDGLASDAGLA
jgi:hypothetical protein